MTTSDSIVHDNPVQRQQVAPTMQLSRRGLIACLASMVAVGLGVYAMFPDSVGGPPLPVQVRVGTRPVEIGNGQARLTDAVVVENQADFAIPRLSIEINGQYLLHRESPLPVDRPLVLAQRVFTDKRSSQRFDPNRHDVTEVIVTGQLPSGARGVSKFEFAKPKP